MLYPPPLPSGWRMLQASWDTPGGKRRACRVVRPENHLARMLKIMPISDQNTSRVNSRAGYKNRCLQTVCAILGGIALAALVAACGSLFGGMGGSGDGQALAAEQMANDMVNKLDRKVTLTYTKLAKVRKILTEYYKKHPGRVGKGGGPAPEKPDKKMTEREEQLELELSVVLNQKEMAAYKELAREQREEWKKRMPEPAPGGSPSGPGMGGRRPSGI